MTATDVGATCYFCLDDGLDDAGQPLMRDCSCRGDTAGFAHQSCIIQYAQQMSKKVEDTKIADFAKPWQDCINCKQSFQGNLSIDLSSAFISFTEANYDYPGNNMYDKIKLISAVKNKIFKQLGPSSNLAINVSSISAMGVPQGFQHKQEIEELIKRMISMIDQTKKDLNMRSWLHMPKTSLSYWYYEELCKYEAQGYHMIGLLECITSSCSYYTWTDDPERVWTGINYLSKARVIYNLLGMEEKAIGIDKSIANLRANLNNSDRDDNLSVAADPFYNENDARATYAMSIKAFGSSSFMGIRSGLVFANKLLYGACHGLEAQRLVTKLTIDSRRIHGPGHHITINAEKLLEDCKIRYIKVYPIGRCQALRYENNGETCVVQGPIMNPRQVDKEQIFHFTNSIVWPERGCPVFLHGLVSASHLNNKVGEVGKFYNHKSLVLAHGIRFAVHFEDNTKPASVRPQNLRVAFDLP